MKCFKKGLKVMKKLINISLCVIVLILGVFVGVVVSVPTSADSANLNTQEHIKPVFLVNENGQTYGSSANCIAAEDFPDLILAVGQDGTEGYVYNSDMQGYTPSSPEDAVRYMNELMELNEQGINSFSIPLYESDGTTVIGEFLLSIDTGMFGTDD